MLVFVSLYFTVYEEVLVFESLMFVSVFAILRHEIVMFAMLFFARRDEIMDNARINYIFNTKICKQLFRKKFAKLVFVVPSEIVFDRLFCHYKYMKKK